MSLDVHHPTIDESTVECRVSPPRELRRFFRGGPFRAEYGVDVGDLPPSLATIPALAHACPVAWTAGVDVEVPVVDRRYLEALREIRGVLTRMYPEFVDGGAINADRVVDRREDHDARAFDDSGLLFTGGVDSIASYVRNRDEDPTLICVQGWVVGVDEHDRWAETRRHVEAFADEHGLETQYVRSNMRSFLDMPMLQAHFKRYLDGAWYSSVGHGLGLVSLCAPLSYPLGLGTIHIAASHTEAFDQPWGSHPDIDDRVRWLATEGHHDGYGLTRQDKVDLVADYVRETGREFPIRTCTQSEAGDNCNRCEKCYRTICGLVLAGLDPERFGYEADADTFERIREDFEAGRFVLDDHTAFHWRDIRSSLAFDREFPADGAREFFQWLSAADVDELAASASPPAHHRLLRAVARNAPYPVYASIYPVYDTVKKLTG